MTTNKPRIAFFGTDEISVFVLDELKQKDLVPNLIVSTPDTHQGRGMKLTPTPVKIWAEKHSIPLLQPEKLNEQFIQELGDDWDLFIVTSYGKILPEKIISIPRYQTLNVHPSLLPLYRGPSPIESAMLDDAKETGVTIMRLDSGVDMGPIVTQELVTFDEWQEKPVIAETLARKGGQLLAETIPLWIGENIEEQEQDHSLATHTKKIEKRDGELNLEDGDDRKNFLKVMAYTPWPGTFFFHNGKRIKITKAHFDDNQLIIEKVIPEGKKEQDYDASR